MWHAHVWITKIYFIIYLTSQLQFSLQHFLPVPLTHTFLLYWYHVAGTNFFISYYSVVVIISMTKFKTCVQQIIYLDCKLSSVIRECNIPSHYYSSQKKSRKIKELNSKNCQVANPKTWKTSFHFPLKMKFDNIHIIPNHFIGYLNGTQGVPENVRAVDIHQYCDYESWLLSESLQLRLIFEMYYLAPIKPRQCLNWKCGCEGSKDLAQHRKLQRFM